MKYKVDGWNNFCRVFELPEEYPNGFCFGVGLRVNFQMVDWFNPISDIAAPVVSKEVWANEVGEIKIKEVSDDELYESLVPWLSEKIYVKPGREYLVLCDFGAVVRFRAKKEK